VHEQNRVPGMTNRLLARFARRVMCGFPDAFPPGPHVEVPGNPVRAAIAGLPVPAQRWADRSGPLRVLVLGGSQGARSLNQVLPGVLAALGTPLQIRHQCGSRMLDDARAAYQRAGVEASVEPFIDDMAAAYAWADVAVCRAGALTLAELAAAGLGSVLVPYPHAVDDHQTRNAEYLVAAGAARLVAEGENLDSRLRAVFADLGDRDRLLRMAESARAQAHGDAARKVAEACLQEARA
jgi:UDP-N-acetylglucosamine--N-acetylmuramyl-(pentapeptide) pyrophosphoryl-undecaprenol N-acetylglucosamine transferase